MPTPRHAFFGGAIVPYSEARVGVLTHALNYGTGVFAGIRAFWNPDERQLFVFRLEDHLRRFLDSTRLLRMELPYAKEELRAGLLDLLRVEGYEEDVYIRPLAFYRDETIGVRLHGLTPEVAMVTFPFGAYLKNETDCHVTISSWRRIADGVIPARGKIAGGYVNSALAKTDAQLAGFDEAILLNDSGHLSEGSAENLFLVRRGVAVTPPVNDDILEGITRSTVMTLLREHVGLEVVERPIDRTELYLADEVFFCGTGVGIVLVTRADHRPIGGGRPGAVGTALRGLYQDTVRGRLAAHRDWCVPVYAAQETPQAVGAAAKGSSSALRP
jgi:branched-chain amino acid aminotransferase